MCESTNITKIISLTYSIIIILIPILYLVVYINKVKNKKRKHFLKAFVIAVIMFSMLFSIKLIGKLSGESCMNCYINNNCSYKINNTNNKENTTRVSSETTEITTTSTINNTIESSTTTTTTSKIISTTTSKKTTTINTGEKKEIGKTSKGYTIYEIDGVTYIDGYMIVNKTYHLPESFVPTNTYEKASGTSTRQCAKCIDNTAYKAWIEMKSDAAALNLNIYISSGYRSYVTQSNIYNRNVNKNGREKADTYSARPGSSEHQTGLCFDLNTITSSFANTKEGKWVNENAYKYGYIIRYPKGKTDETGYIYEPWHLRYVGKELAEKLYNNGDWLTIEDYFGITSKYND